MAEIKARTEGNNEVAEFEDLHPECPHFWLIDAPVAAANFAQKDSSSIQNCTQTASWEPPTSHSQLAPEASMLTAPLCKVAAVTPPRLPVASV